MGHAAEDISEYFMRAMLSNKIGEMYSDKLKGWWEKFGSARWGDSGAPTIEDIPAEEMEKAQEWHKTLVESC